MTFRRRTILIAACAVASAILASSVVVYIVTRDELGGQIDTSLKQKLTPGGPLAVQVVSGGSGRATLRTDSTGAFAPLGAELQTEAKAAKQPQELFTFIRRALLPGMAAAGATAGAASTRRATAQGTPSSTLLPSGARAGFDKLVLPAPQLGGPTGFVQLYSPGGKLLSSGHALLPVTAAAKQVASGTRNAFFSDVTIGGTRARMLTERAPGGGVWQVALPLAETENTLGRLRMLLAIISLGGIAVAVALGAIVSRAASAPLKRLTDAAERVTRTQDLGHRIETRESDELGRLAASFNTMLAALERSRSAQRRLISDASHELRTPITSVQANLDALALGAGLQAPERARAIAAAQAQLGELTTLVGDLVSLSQTEVGEIELEDVRLDIAASEAIARARLHAPDRRFDLDAEPSLVHVSPARLARAISNLLDNACKWSEPASPVEVRVRDGVLEVRDHGPGIPADDLPRVFDRFYRAAAARGLPGSGLGLAIVRQFAESHGGSVHAANDHGGGARLTVELPTLVLDAAEREPIAVGAGAPPALHEAPPSR